MVIDQHQADYPPVHVQPHTQVDALAGKAGKIG